MKFESRSRLTATTRVVGLLGHPVGHSLSPLMHNAAFSALGLDLCYLAFDVSPRNLKRVVASMRALGWVGLNLTIPHKEAVISCLDRVAPDARLIGAVNTVVRTRGRLVGYNTDGRGFLEALRRAWDEGLKGRRILILGAGGAARAIAVQAALEAAAEVTIANRSLPRARALARHLLSIRQRMRVQVTSLGSAGLRLALKEVDLVVNATAVGMKPADRALIPAEWLHPGQRIYDLIYTTTDTPLLRAGRMVGAKTLNGLDMLVHQGALSQRLWTGHAAPIEVMKAAIRQGISS